MKLNWKEILDLGYPQNILFVLGIENPSEDQIQGFYYLLDKINLKEQNKDYLLYRFKKQKTLAEIADIFNVTRQAVDANIKYNLEKIRNNKDFIYIAMGYNRYIKLVEDKKKENEKREKDARRKRLQRKIENNSFHDVRVDAKKKGYFLKDKPISQKAYTDLLENYRDMMSIRVYNALVRSSKKYTGVTVGDVIEKIKEDPYWYKNIRNLGKDGVMLLYKTLLKVGYLTKFEFDYLCSFKGSTHRSYYKPKEKDANMDYWYSDKEEWG